ncbi:adenylate kinase and related kinase [Paenibacillus alvei]|uniref:Adenylate kinase and related kinase n=1 Tax=Paenibacillus alvei TaxID=44250 RepID=A0ABT4GRX4_PAEAL|nr:adenylate kinase and related kinase [Paenibacillus alvei]MCY9759445.1 adenylate kinase and related kinase [Paenibacillus alvei]MCY9766241.1 adenylate kinase and related kinase [Paenibacillus alvei]
MNRQLLNQTSNLLTQHLPPITGIQLTAETDEYWLLDTARMLNAYEMEQHERQVLLGCYWLLRQALRTHQHVPEEEQLAGKAVLDGDFLLSLYYQFAVRHGMTQLIIELATTNKRIQIRRVEGAASDMMLHQRMGRFVAAHYKQVASYGII